MEVNQEVFIRPFGNSRIIVDPWKNYLTSLDLEVN